MWTFQQGRRNIRCTIEAVKMNRIRKLFAGKKNNILSVFYTAGFPHLDDTVCIGEALEAAGVDLIEIGIPFSDPIADGPVIQNSNKQALDNGMHVALLLEQVAVLRSKVKMPIVLMGYVNPLMQFGMEVFCKQAALAGVDGLIIPDLPLAVYQSQYQAIFEAHGLCNILLIAPTTSEERIRKIDGATEGFIYAVSASSTTGARKSFVEGQIHYFDRINKMGLKSPLLIGFGISNAATFGTACEYASGAIVGSAFVELLKHSNRLEQDIHQFVKDIRG